MVQQALSGTTSRLRRPPHARQHDAPKRHGSPTTPAANTQTGTNVPMMDACLIALTSSSGVTTRSDSPSMMRRYNGSASAGEATANASARSSTPARVDCWPVAAGAASAAGVAAPGGAAEVSSMAAAVMMDVGKASKCSKTTQGQALGTTVTFEGGRVVKVGSSCWASLIPIGGGPTALLPACGNRT